MELFAQQVLNGLVTGSVYSLVALGLTLIYGTMQVPNFAHGQLFMLGAYLSYTLVTRAGVHYWGRWPSRWRRLPWPAWPSSGWCFARCEMRRISIR